MLVPLALLGVLYIWTLCSHSYWLDSSELAAASFSLGIPHPPGHPLYLFLSKAFTLIPLGPLGLKISLLSAVCGLASTYFLLRILHATGQGCFPKWAGISPWLLLGATGLFGLSSAMWLQSVRPEVYTLQTAIHMAILWQFISIYAPQRPEQDKWRHFLVACFLLGTGGLNHHYLALFTVPVGLFVFVQLCPFSPAIIFKRLGQAILCIATPILGYGFLMIRASQNPYINWVNPSNYDRFLDVILARVFQASVVDQGGEDLSWNYLQGILSLMEQTSPVLFPFVVLGIIVVWKKARPIALIALLFMGFNILSTSLMSFDRLNPDTWGYLQSGLGIWVLLSLIGIGRIIEMIQSHPRTPKSFGSWALAVVVSLAVFGQFSQHHTRSNLGSFSTAERFEDSILRELPPSSMHLSSFFGIYFNHWFAQIIDGRRPDVLIVSQSFDQKIHGGIPYAENISKYAGDWKPVFDAFLERKEVPYGLLNVMAQVRPVFFEPEAPSPFARHARPSGLLLQLCPGCAHPATPAAEDEYAAFHAVASHNPETRNIMAWHHFQSASLFLQMEMPEFAIQEVQLGQQLIPDSPQWNHLTDQIVTLKTRRPDEQ